MISRDILSIAQTLGARVETDDLLSRAELWGLAATLESIAHRVAHMEAQPVPIEKRMPVDLRVICGGLL